MKDYSKLFLTALFALFLFGCSSEPLKVTVDIEEPYLVTGFKVPIKGSLNNQKITHIFYQFEDGHSFLGNGKIILDQSRFDALIEISHAPSNPHGSLIFYLDEDEDSNFDPETDTATMLGSIALDFDEKLIDYGVIEE